MSAGCSLNCHHRYSGHPDKPPAPHREAGFYTWWDEGEGQKFEGFLLQVATRRFPARVWRAVRAAAWSKTSWQGVAKLRAQWVQLDRELPGKTLADFFKFYLFIFNEWAQMLSFAMFKMSPFYFSVLSGIFISYFTFSTEAWRNPGNYYFFPISRHFPAFTFIFKWFFLGVLGASNELKDKCMHRTANCLWSGPFSWQSPAGDRRVPRWGLADVNSSSGVGCWCPSTTQTCTCFGRCTMKDPCQHCWVPLNIQVSPFITTSSSQKSQHRLKNNEI